MEEPIFFSTAFEALFARALHGHLSLQLKDELRAAGLDPDKPLKAAYPFKVWEDVMAACGRELFPGLDDVEAARRLGVAFFDGFSATVIGKASLAMARLIGLDRVLGKFTSNMRHTNNAAEGFVELREPGRVLLRLRIIEKFRGKIHPSPPAVSHYLAGVLQAMLHSMGFKDPRVELIESNRELRDALYELTWTEKR